LIPQPDNGILQHSAHRLIISQLRSLLAIPPNADVKFDRFSDSAGSYITLDSSNPSIYKQLYRAAKAKLKLRLRATIIKKQVNLMDDQSSKAEPSKAAAAPVPKVEHRPGYLETVLSLPAQTNAIPKPVSEPPRQLQPTCSIPGAFNPGEAYAEPLPRPTPREVLLSKPTLPSFHDFSTGSFSIDCNYCSKSIPNEHYHCSICEKGDFDLCQACVDAGVTCDGEDHWLIKRFIRNGAVIPSVTETCAPRKQAQAEQKTETPVTKIPEEGERTCNACINRKSTPNLAFELSLISPELPGSEFVTCKNCADYDLCFDCFAVGGHGHHPAHVFEPVDKDNKDAIITDLCGAGRGLIHQATCDGCNKVSFYLNLQT
jgi:next to BRCA1 gene 1 protein